MNHYKVKIRNNIGKITKSDLEPEKIKLGLSH
jgi:hypothetical protein